MTWPRSPALTTSLSRDEWLGLMVDRQVTVRADKRIRNKLAPAKLRFAEASIEDMTLPRPAVSTGATRLRLLKEPGCDLGHGIRR